MIKSMQTFISVDPAIRTLAITKFINDVSEGITIIEKTDVFDLLSPNYIKDDSITIKKWKKIVGRTWLNQLMKRFDDVMDKYGENLNGDLGLVERPYFSRKKQFGDMSGMPQDDYALLVGSIHENLRKRGVKVELVRNRDCRKFLKTKNGKDLRANDRKKRKEKSVKYAKECLDGGNYSYTSHEYDAMVNIDHCADTLLMYEYKINGH